MVENKDENKVPFYQLATTQLQLTISDLREVDYEFIWEIERKYLVVVPNEVDGSLSVVDINENKVIDTIEIGEKAGHGIAVDPQGRYLYAGDMEEGGK